MEHILGKHFHWAINYLENVGTWPIHGHLEIFPKYPCARRCLTPEESKFDKIESVLALYCFPMSILPEK